MDKETIKKIILKYNTLVPENIFKRDLEISEIKLNKAITIIGPRRAGKSYYLYSLFKKEEKPVFINFEDNQLQGIKNNELELIKECAKELFGPEKLTYFFDEIQEVDNWEKFIVTIINEGNKVFLTGSNSKLLSKEISTSLRGKSLPFLLMPYSFKEFLKSKQIEITDKTMLTDEVYKIKRKFKEYFEFGGFPEITTTKEKGMKSRLALSYYESVIYKDLIDRLKITNTTLIETTINYIINNFGHKFSITSFENHLKSTKTPYSLEDIYKILDSLEDIFFAHYIKKYSKSFRKERLSKSKIYLSDNAYITFLSKEPEDNGRKLENLIFQELYRQQKTISYYSQKNECDFITQKTKITQAIQVCYTLNEQNKKRELNGLTEAMEFFKLKHGTIITLEQEETIKIKGKTIQITPAWKWLLKK